MKKQSNYSDDYTMKKIKENLSNEKKITSISSNNIISILLCLYQFQDFTSELINHQYDKKTKIINLISGFFKDFRNRKIIDDKLKNEFKSLINMNYNILISEIFKKLDSELSKNKAILPLEQNNKKEAEEKFNKEHQNPSIIEKLFFIKYEEKTICPNNNKENYKYNYEYFITVNLYQENKIGFIKEKLLEKEKKIEKIKCFCNKTEKLVHQIEKKYIKFPEILIVIIESENNFFLNEKFSFRLESNSNNILYFLYCFIEKDTNIVYFKRDQFWYRYNDVHQIQENCKDIYQKNPKVLFYHANFQNEKGNLKMEINAFNNNNMKQDISNKLLNNPSNFSNNNFNNKMNNMNKHMSLNNNFNNNMNNNNMNNNKNINSNINYMNNNMNNKNMNNNMNSNSNINYMNNNMNNNMNNINNNINNYMNNNVNNNMNININNKVNNNMSNNICNINNKININMNNNMNKMNTKMDNNSHNFNNMVINKNNNLIGVNNNNKMNNNNYNINMINMNCMNMNNNNNINFQNNFNQQNMNNLNFCFNQNMKNNMNFNNFNNQSNLKPNTNNNFINQGNNINNALKNQALIKNDNLQGKMIFITFTFKANNKQIFLDVNENEIFENIIIQLKEKYLWLKDFKNLVYYFNNKKLSENFFKTSAKNLGLKDNSNIIIDNIIK